MITLTQRQKEIIEYLVNLEDYVKIDKIADTFGVSARTIRYDLDVLQNYVENVGINIIRRPKLGVKIENSALVREKLLESLRSFTSRVFSQEERTFLSIIYLITSSSYTVEKLSEKLSVSKNTIMANLPDIEKRLESFEIKLNKKTYYGMTIEGEEETIRNAFSNLYYEGLKRSLLDKSFINEILNPNGSFQVDKIIEYMEESMNISYSDTSKEELEVSLLFTFKRTSLNFRIHYSEEIIKKYKGYKEFQALKILREKEEGLKNLDTSDLCYIANLFRGAKIMYLLEGNQESEEEDEAKILARQIIQDSEKYLGVDFSGDVEFIGGLALHLKVALHRLRNNLIIENPLTEQIKYRITFIYEITKKILEQYENITQVIFPEDEVAYIAMHIGAAFEKNIQNGFMPNVLVVCGSGIATSGILSTRLRIMLPELKIIGPFNIDDIENIIRKRPIDFIISTVDIKMPEYEVIKVNPLLDVEDIEKIKNLIFKTSYKKQCDYLIKRYEAQVESKTYIKDIVEREDTKFKVPIKDWKEAIKLAAQSLVNKNYIGYEYVSAMIKAVEELGPYMVFIPKIAFVHASPKYSVKKECISLITLDEEIKFGEGEKEKVRTIIVFAAKESNSNVLTKIVSILENKDNISKIENAASFEDIENLSS